MAVTLTIGHTLNMSISFLDQHGNPMLTPPTLDNVPSWTDTTSSTETLSISASGLTCTGTPIAVGTDTVNLSLSSQGKTFTATVDVTVTAEPQVLTGIAINTVVA